jgi:PAS domain S-box-containing protein
MFGYTAAEAIGQPLIDLVVPAHRVGEERAFLREAVGQGLATSESIRRRKDGSLVHVSVSARTVRDEDGTVRYLLVSKKDVSQLKVMRDAKLVDARYRDLLESMPDGIVMVNPTGRIVFANGQAEAMFGYERGALRGKLIETLLPERLRSVHVAHRAAYFSQLRTRAMGAGLELHGLRRDGTEFPVEISLSPLQTEEGTLISSAIRDITERKRFERALQEKNIELAKANAAKDHFLASMSHELRTPLNAIIGFTGTLLLKLPGPLNADQEKQLRTVQQSARHLLALINDLLDIARIEAGKFEPVIEAVDATAILEELAGTLRPEAEGKDLGLLLDLPGETCVIETDRRAFSQIVINLLQNAIKFTERGGIRLGLNRVPDDGRPAFEIRIEDSGIGIETADQVRLFAPFSRIRPTAGKPAEGTGLGLHLSQKLAAQLGGRIAVQSTYGEGSVFSLILPER